MTLQSTWFSVYTISRQYSRQIIAPAWFDAGMIGAIGQMESNAMNIQLTPEQEKVIKAEIESGHFQSAEEVIAEALQVLRVASLRSASDTPTVAERSAVREMVAFVEQNRVILEDVSVKELIHEGHRL
jgi:Arc/MetJ-type ribon-helix-helix transcriptional regulator